jgi:hypothetical protein
VKYQYRLNSGAWADVPAGQWLTSAADASVYGTSVTVEFRGCRDASDSYCGPASTATTLMPINTRATILGCQAGGAVAISPPGNNAAAVTVSYKVKYNRPVLGADNWDLAWTAYSSSDTAPANASEVEVQATVTVTANGNDYTDPGFGGPFACTP